MWLLVVSQTLTKNELFLLGFPGSPVVKTLPSNAGGECSIPGQEAKIPHALGPKTKTLKKKKKKKKNLFTKQIQTHRHRKQIYNY